MRLMPCKKINDIIVCYVTMIPHFYVCQVKSPFLLVLKHWITSINKILQFNLGGNVPGVNVGDIATSFLLFFN